MRCSQCSEKVKPIVAIDIDGTLGDYHGHFLRFATAYMGRDLDMLLELSLRMYDGSEPFREYCAREFDITVDEYRDIKLAYRQGAQKRSMPIIDGAPLLTASLRGLGVELWLTTTRPYLSLDGVIKDTMFWLDLHNISYDGLLFDDDKYTVLAERVDPARVIGVLDDVDEMYDSAVSLFGEGIPIIYANKYNGAMLRGRLWTGSLRAAKEMIESELLNWRATYGQT